MGTTGPSLARRLLDVTVAGAALLILLPVLLLVAVAVKATSPGPVLFRQVRVGQDGRVFVLVKFRSMRVGLGGPQVTVGDDPRVTPLGRWLRATSVDELPQLWHVLRGEMTLVGPRPETPALAARYPADSQWVLAQRPGLTGPAQLQLRDDGALNPAALDVESDYLERLVPLRTALDAEYLGDPSAARTLALLMATARTVIGGRPQPVLTPAPGPEAGRTT